MEKKHHLNELVNQLIVATLPTAVKRHSFIINDVFPETPVTINENIMALVLGNLLNDAVSHTENDCIRISASKEGNATLISMKNYDVAASKSFAHCMETIQLIAERFGGYIRISSRKANGTNLAINFFPVLKTAC